MREAIRHMDDRDRYRRLKSAIAEGDADLARGEEVQISSSLVEDMKRDAERMALAGVEPDPDVCP